MSIIQRVLEKSAQLSEVEYDYTNTNDFNLARNLDDGCNAIVMEATVIYFEIGNINILLKTGKRLASRAYKIYYNALKEVCQETGGHLNCYSPQSFLMIYPKSKFDITYAVDVAMKTADLFSVTLTESLENHGHANFSIGVDNGNILGTMTSNELNDNHIAWFGTAIEKAIAISHLCQKPYNVGISGTVFHHLDDSLRKTTKRILGIKRDVDVWTRVSYDFDNTKKHLYQTNIHKSFDN